MTEFHLRTYAFPDEVERAARRAEDLGWDGMLFQDSQNLTPDIVVAMTLAARATQRLTVGTAVTNLVTRNPAVVASTFATVQHVSAGRCSLGVARGDTALLLVGEHPPSTDAFGDLVREVRAYLSGTAVHLKDSDSRIQWLPDSEVPPVPITIFASGPRNLALAAELGDRVTVTVGAEPDQVAWAVGQVRAVRPDASVGAMVVSAVGEDRAALRELIRANASISTHFRRDAVAELNPADAAVVERVTRDYDSTAHATATATQARELPADYLDRFCIIGDADECADRLAALINLGLDHVVIVGAGRDTDPAVRRAADDRYATDVLARLR